MKTDDPIVFISYSRIRPGQLNGLQAFIAGSVPALMAGKPQTAAFLAYVDEASMTLTIVHLFANAASFAAHVEGADDRSDAAAVFIERIAIEIHGAPEKATIASIRSGLPDNIPMQIGAEYLGGFLRLSP